MSKNNLFFSHSSKDKEVLSKLKELFITKTAETIDVFLSSDGQSIPLGRNWIHRIQKALDEASLMVVFITPNSVRSSWIYFEAGYAYSKGIRVVPVGFLGIDIASVGPPLTLLQGFNISNHEGLNNIIALANEVFKSKHTNFFTESEYDELTVKSDISAKHPLGEFLPVIDSVNINVGKKEGFEFVEEDAIIKATNIFDNHEIDYRKKKGNIETFGLCIHVSNEMTTPSLNFVADPMLLQTTIPLITEILKEINPEGIRNVPLRFDFIHEIGCLGETHKITARLFGKDIKLIENNKMIYENQTFLTSRLINYRGRGDIRLGATYLSVCTSKEEFELEKVADLLKILFEHNVLYRQEETFTSYDQ